MNSHEREQRESLNQTLDLVQIKPNRVGRPETQSENCKKRVRFDDVDLVNEVVSFKEIYYLLNNYYDELQRLDRTKNYSKKSRHPRLPSTQDINLDRVRKQLESKKECTFKAYSLCLMTDNLDEELEADKIYLKAIKISSDTEDAKGNVEYRLEYRTKFTQGKEPAEITKADFLGYKELYDELCTRTNFEQEDPYNEDGKLASTSARSKYTFLEILSQKDHLSPKDKTDRIKILSALEDKLDKLDQVTQRTFYGNLNDLIAISEIPFQRPEKIEETEQPDQQVSSIMEQSTQPPRPNDTARLLDMLTKKLSNETSQKVQYLREKLQKLAAAEREILTIVEQIPVLKQKDEDPTPLSAKYDQKRKQVRLTEEYRKGLVSAYQEIGEYADNQSKRHVSLTDLFFSKNKEIYRSLSILKDAQKISDIEPVLAMATLLLLNPEETLEIDKEHYQKLLIKPAYRDRTRRSRNIKCRSTSGAAEPMTIDSLKAIEKETPKQSKDDIDELRQTINLMQTRLLGVWLNDIERKQQPVMNDILTLVNDDSSSYKEPDGLKKYYAPWVETTSPNSDILKPIHTDLSSQIKDDSLSDYRKAKKITVSRNIDLTITPKKQPEDRNDRYTLLAILKEKLSNNTSNNMQKLYKKLEAINENEQKKSAFLTLNDQFNKKNSVSENLVGCSAQQDSSSELDTETSDYADSSVSPVEREKSGLTESPQISVSKYTKLQTGAYKDIGDFAHTYLHSRSTFMNLFFPKNKKIYHALSVLRDIRETHDIDSALAMAVLPLLDSNDTIEINMIDYQKIVIKPDFFNNPDLYKKIKVRAVNLENNREMLLNNKLYYDQTKYYDTYYDNVLKKARHASLEEKQKITNLIHEQIGAKPSNKIYVRILAEELKANFSLITLKRQIAKLEANNNPTELTDTLINLKANDNSTELTKTLIKIKEEISEHYQQASSCFSRLFSCFQTKQLMPPGIQATHMVLENKLLTEDQKCELIQAIGIYKKQHPSFGKRSQETIEIYEKAAAAAA